MGGTLSCVMEGMQDRVKKRQRKSSTPKSLRKWLQDLGLQSYIGGLELYPQLMGTNGLDALQALLKLGDLGLQNFGVNKMGHRCKMRYYAKQELHALGISPHKPDDDDVQDSGTAMDDEPMATAMEDTPIVELGEPAPALNTGVKQEEQPTSQEEQPTSQEEQPTSQE